MPPEPANKLASTVKQVVALYFCAEVCHGAYAVLRRLASSVEQRNVKSRLADELQGPKGSYSCHLYLRRIYRAGTSNYIPQILWGVITCPCPIRILLLWEAKVAFNPHVEIYTDKLKIHLSQLEISLNQLDVF